MATINDRFLDYQVARQIRWIRLSNKEVREMLRLMRRLDRSITDRLRTVNPENTPYTAARLDALKKQVSTMITDFHQHTLSRNILKTADEVAELSARLETGAFKRFLPAGLDVTTPNIGVMQRAASLRPMSGGMLEDWLTKLAKDDVDRTWAKVLDGITGGQTTDDIIRDVIGTRSLGYKDGVREVSRRGVETFVRTSINHAASQGRQLVWEANNDIVKGVRWVSTLDTRTTPICRDRDGKMGPVTADPTWSPPPGVEPLTPPMARPPAHPNCRSTTVVVTKSWKELGFDVEELPAGTRASMDGQVPADMTYYEWLNRQSAEVQKDVLGPGRYKLWKESGVSPEKFVNDRGRTLTLDELKKEV